MHAETLAPAHAEPAAASSASRPARLVSVDLVRGLVIVLMALDHARTFVSGAPFAPENLHATDLPHFLTRWVTHFCAPLFFLLAGAGAWLYGARAGGAALRRFLVTRGLWLIALELTVIGFAWSFRPGSNFAGVIWCLGWAFLSLAVLAALGPRALLALGAAVIVLHNAFDADAPRRFGELDWLYGLAHRAGGIELPWGAGWRVLFPWVWIAAAWVGYGLGPSFELPAARRRALFLRLGAALVLAFAVLRATNAYGDPSWGFLRGTGDFAVQESAAKTVISFLDTEKYPPSLQFLLMTLGPGLLLLGAWAGRDERAGGGVLERVLLPFGRTPFLFYLLHLYAFHLAQRALAAGLGNGGRLGLPGVYAVWIAVTALLWFPCARWAEARARRGAWWMKYL